MHGCTEEGFLASLGMTERGWAHRLWNPRTHMQNRPFEALGKHVGHPAERLKFRRLLLVEILRRKRRSSG
jgi:hypothetical protein